MVYEKMDNCALLICSCDKNEDLWGMFFYYFHKYWSGCDLPIYLNTESKTFYDKYFKIQSFGMFPNGDDDKWSLRLRRHLERIPEDYVVLILDDFFVREEVDEDELAWCLDEMKRNDNIAVFLFDPTPGPNVVSEYKKYEKKEEKLPIG